MFAKFAKSAQFPICEPQKPDNGKSADSNRREDLIHARKIQQR
jgi:hypothetical protein